VINDNISDDLSNIGDSIDNNSHIIDDKKSVNDYKNGLEVNTNIQNMNLLSFVEFSKKAIKLLYVFVKYIIKLSGIYLLWIVLHFVAAHLYIQFCVPSNFIGFVISPFMTASPHCQGLRWIIYTGANTINNMWVILGTWLCSYLIQLGGTSRDDN
jgi:hypothetical protein